jgi:subtilisin family serine protease
MRPATAQRLGSLASHLVLLAVAACSADRLADSGGLDRSTGAPSGPSATQSAARLVVRLGSGDPSAAAAAIAALGGRVERRILQLNVVEVSGLGDAGAARLRSHPGVLGVEPDQRRQWVPPFTTARRANRVAVAGVRPQGTDQSGAFFFAAQWNLRRVEARTGWHRTPAGAGALVCVLDTGVDWNQQDLVGRVNLAKSASFVPHEPFLEDLHFHGTFVSTLVTSNGIGIGSVASDGRLCAVKVLDRTGVGSFFDIAAGMVFAADQGADVLNLSLGGYVDLAVPGQRFFFDLLQGAATYAIGKGALIVASAGNDGLDLDGFGTLRLIPAQLNGVLGVSATAPFGQHDGDAMASYSNIGTSVVDLAAPGGDLLPGGELIDLVLGACSRFVCGGDGFYLFAAGTSAAAPHVAAAGGVAESQQAGNQDGASLMQCLFAGADVVSRLSQKQQGNGRVNVVGAAACAAEP